MFNENLSKRDPCLENYVLKNPPYGRYIPLPSTCYVSPGTRGGGLTGAFTKNDFIEKCTIFIYSIDFDATQVHHTMEVNFSAIFFQLSKEADGVMTE